MKKLSIIVVLCLVALSAGAQWKWINPMDAGFSVIQSQGFTDEIGKTYVRLPDRAKDVVRKDVWDLSRHSAGLAIYFYSNAPTMQIRYQVAKDYRLSYGMSHMPATGCFRRDLYSINSDGKWNIRHRLVQLHCEQNCLYLHPSRPFEISQTRRRVPYLSTALQQCQMAGNRRSRQLECHIHSNHKRQTNCCLRNIHRTRSLCFPSCNGLDHHFAKKAGFSSHQSRILRQRTPRERSFEFYLRD